MLEKFLRAEQWVAMITFSDQPEATYFCAWSESTFDLGSPRMIRQFPVQGVKKGLALMKHINWPTGPCCNNMYRLNLRRWLVAKETPFWAPLASGASPEAWKVRTPRRAPRPRRPEKAKRESSQDDRATPNIGPSKTSAPTIVDCASRQTSGSNK